jgi:hypothetical protein
MTVLALAALLFANTPQPFTESQSRDIGCLAVISIIAEEQRRGASGADGYPDVREARQIWADTVIPRISAESGQSEEVVKSAVWDAVSTEQARVQNVADPKSVVDGRMQDCLPVMRSELGTGGLDELSRENDNACVASDMADHDIGAGPCPRIDAEPAGRPVPQ